MNAFKHFIKKEKMVGMFPPLAAQELFNVFIIISSLLPYIQMLETSKLSCSVKLAQKHVKTFWRSAQVTTTMDVYFIETLKVL